MKEGSREGPSGPADTNGTARPRCRPLIVREALSHITRPRLIRVRAWLPTPCSTVPIPGVSFLRSVF